MVFHYLCQDDSVGYGKEAKYFKAYAVYLQD